MRIVREPKVSAFTFIDAKVALWWVNHYEEAGFSREEAFAIVHAAIQAQYPAKARLRVRRGRGDA
jgi:hypothetical protein